MSSNTLNKNSLNYNIFFFIQSHPPPRNLSPAKPPRKNESRANRSKKKNNLPSLLQPLQLERCEITMTPRISRFVGSAKHPHCLGSRGGTWHSTSEKKWIERVERGRREKAQVFFLRAKRGGYNVYIFSPPRARAERRRDDPEAASAIDLAHGGASRVRYIHRVAEIESYFPLVRKRGEKMEWKHSEISNFAWDLVGFCRCNCW